MEIVKKAILVWFLANFFALSSSGQGYYNYEFKALTVNDNLSHSDVNCIVQDEDGFVWIGTNNGLNKYNGYEIETFKYSVDDPKSLPGNRIRNLLVDKNGVIWMTIVNKGLYKFHPRRMDFEKIQLSGIDESKEIPNIFDMTMDYSGLMWVETGSNKLLRLEIDENSQVVNSEHYQLDRKTNEHITSLETTSWGTAYLTNQGELNIFSSNSDFGFHTIEQVQEYGPIGAIHGTIEFLYVATSSHILKYSFASGEINLADKITLPKEGQERISDLLVDLQGDIWLVKRNKVSKLLQSEMEQSSEDIIQERSFAINHASRFFEDRFGILWVVANGEGLYYTSIIQKPFFHLFDDQNEDRLNVSIYKDSKNRIWLGSRTGLAVSDPVASSIQDLTYTQYLQSQNIAFISNDSRGNLWVGSKNTGLLKVSETPNGFKFTNIQDLISTDISNMKTVMRMTEDGEGRLWVSTFLNGIFVIDLGTRSAMQLKHDDSNTNSISSDLLTDIYYDSLINAVWVSTRDAGLNKITLGKQELEVSQYRYDPGDKTSISSNHTWQILRLQDSSLWVATLGGGLNKVIVTSNEGDCTFKRYTTTNGLIDNDVEAMAEDKDGNLWLSGYGLTKFNPANESFHHFSHSDGLQSNSFKVGAVFTDERDQLYFGGINGVNYFDPSKILSDTIPPTVLISDVIVNNGDLVYDVNTTASTEPIELKSSENNVSFNFVGLQFDGAEKNQYKYKLEGHDDNWTSTVYPNLSANYLNVPPGRYTFKVMASNKDGAWSPEVGKVNLQIFKPWYLTHFAFLIYLLLIVAALYLYKRITENQIKLKNDLLLAEKEHELDRSKLSFFTKISHELRSPLTLIKGPLEELLLFPKIGQGTKNKLQLMQKSTDRLLKLTNQLLDFRKMETGNMKIKARRQNFVKFANELFLLFSQSASSKNITFEFVSSGEEYPLMFDADKMEIILMNLLSNAFKYTDVGGTIRMEISAVGHHDEEGRWKNGELVDHYLLVRVIDDGAGMSLNEVKKVFNPYYQVKKVSMAQPIGTGLGLSLVKGLIKLHGGDIIISSSKGNGTVCESRLPFGDKHLESSQIDQTDYIDDLVLTYNNLEEKSAVSQDKPLYLDRLSELHKKNKLLIVEDNVELNKYIKEVLSQHYVVESAFNGLEGFESALDFEPDIILSDVMMPLLDGIGLCEKIKADDQTAHIPIILLTARTSFVYELNGLTKGAEDYISKPFSVSLLITKINAILKNRELQREFYRKQMFFEPIKENHLNPDEQIVFEAIKYIEANVDSAELDVKSLSEALFQSQSNLYRKVKLVTGKSIVELIKDVRIQNAAKLLREEKWTVTQVAYKSGFNSIKYFRKCFKKQYNVNPSEFHLVDFDAQKGQLRDQVKYN